MFELSKISVFKTIFLQQNICEVGKTITFNLFMVATALRPIAPCNLYAAWLRLR